MKSVSEMLDARQQEADERQRTATLRDIIAGLLAGAVLAAPVGYVAVKMVAAAAATAVQAENMTGESW